MTHTLSSAIRAAAEEIGENMGNDLVAPIEELITRHLSPILDPSVGDEATRAAEQIGEIHPANIYLSMGDRAAAERIIQLAISQSQAPLVERVGILEAEVTFWRDTANRNNERVCELLENSLRVRQALTPKEKV